MILLLIYGLAGCATILESVLAPIPVKVRVIHSDRTASGERGHYVYASPGEEPNISDTADLVTTVDWSIGIVYRSQEIVEWMAKDLAFRNEANIVVIRPSDTLDRVVWKLHVEVWRTKGYTQHIEDDIPKRGTTLIPPPGMTYTTRRINIEECASEAVTLHFRALTEQEMSLVAGRDTRRFVDFVGSPRRDFFWRPTKLGWESTALDLSIKKNGTVRYVACLMKRGYLWP